MPLERVPSDVLFAYELNGAPLPAEYGFPARLVVPGFYSTNSVKWRDPRVGLPIIAMQNPYEEAQLRGRVIERFEFRWKMLALRISTRRAAGAG